MRSRSPKERTLEARRERNRRALARLAAAAPAPFPAQVLTHARGRAYAPALPRLAVDAYWRAHPLRADRLARALAARSGAPSGWRWRLGEGDGLAASFRAPPAPYREASYALGPGHCCICGQVVYRFGWHRDLWGKGPNRNAEWHSACVVAWRLWNAPSDQARLLKRLQGRRCAESGRPLARRAEVDHRTPLFEVWREHKGSEWPKLLAFWGVPNLRVVNRDAHAEKCALEARSRRRLASPKPRPGPPWLTVGDLMASLEKALDVSFSR